MIHTVLLLSALLRAVAFAQPSPEVERWVKDSIRAGITLPREREEIIPCMPRRVRIVGTDPITFRPRAVRIVEYVPAGFAPRGKTVLIFPPTGGENALDRAYAHDFCSRNIRAVILQGYEGDMRRDADLGTYDRGALRLLAAAENALEYLRPAGDVGVLGTSLGALGAAFVMNYDARIKTGVLIVGGSHMSEIIARSDETHVKATRSWQMRRNGIRSVDDFERALRRELRLDTTTFAGYSGPKNVLLYVGSRDTTVPTKTNLI